MHIRDFERLIKVAGGLVKVIRGLKPSFGIIHKAEVIMKDEKVRGYLVWDYLLFNEICYIEIDGNNLQKLFATTCDKEAEERFQVLCHQYGIVKNNISMK